MFNHQYAWNNEKDVLVEFTFFLFLDIASSSSLLLFVRLGKVVGFSFLGLLGPDSPKSGNCSCLTDTIEGFEVLEVIGELHGADPLDDRCHIHNVAT